MASIRTRLTLLGIAAATALGTSSCALPGPLQSVSMSPRLSTAQARSGSTAVATTARARGAAVPPSAAPVVAPIPRAHGDLDSGSATHSLAAGARTLVISYWSTSRPRTWTPATPAVVQLSAHLQGGGRENAVTVTRFAATLDGRQVADDRGEFVLTPPFSYGTALQLPTMPATTRSADLTVQLDLLVETAPGSHAYFRQTVLDTLTIAYADTKDNA